MQFQESQLTFEDVLDAKVYLTVSNVLLSDEKGNELRELLVEIASLINRHKGLRFTTTKNILELVLLYTSPHATSLQDVEEMVEGFLTCTQSFSEDLEEAFNRIDQHAPAIVNSGPDQLIVNTANELMISSSFEAQAYNFDVSSGSDVLNTFLGSRVVFLSNYYLDISEFSSVLAKIDHGPLQKWYVQIVKPFTYYWKSYGEATDASGVRFNEFVRITSFSGKFDALISPLNEVGLQESRVSTSNWMSQVILPLVRYHDNDFGPMISWLFDETHFADRLPSVKYRLWLDTIKSITSYTDMHGDGFAVKDYIDLVKYFLASCYYYSINRETSSNVSSMEMLKVYDNIRDTVSILMREIGHGTVITDVSLSSDEIFSSEESLLEFMQNHGSLGPLFQPTQDAIATLNSTIITCEKLYPINKLTISDYVRLRYSAALDYSSKEKEITRIMHGLNESNYNQLLTSARLFTNAFIAIDPNHELQINKLIVERFLVFDLFDIVRTFYENKEFGLSTDTIFELVAKKFWDSFDQATSLNDKVGKLNQATKCVQLFDMLSLDPNLSEESRAKIIKIKHLLKAISNMKNFKIFIERGAPLTPHQLITQFGIVGTKDTEEKYSPLNLITIILEHNPKSYLAYEKLYKILVDLLIFLDDNGSTISETYLPKIKSACIESALIDNNFDYAYKHSVELLDHFKDKDTSELNKIWLTFYQVGKFVPPEWFNDYNPAVNNKKIAILLKQRDVLALALKYIRPNDTSIDNSKLIVRQWDHINHEIENWYTSLQTNTSSSNHSSNRADKVKENFGALTNDLISDATNTTNQASEKLSNLFVSGLGWAIGANSDK